MITKSKNTYSNIFQRKLRNWHTCEPKNHDIVTKSWFTVKWSILGAKLHSLKKKNFTPILSVHLWTFPSLRTGLRFPFSLHSPLQFSLLLYHRYHRYYITIFISSSIPAFILVAPAFYLIHIFFYFLFLNFCN